MRILLPIILLLAGCATAPAVRVDNECVWVKPLTFSTQDTAETKREIIALSDKIKANCADQK